MSFKRAMKRKQEKEFKKQILNMVKEEVKNYTPEQHAENYKKFIDEQKKEEGDE